MQKRKRLSWEDCRAYLTKQYQHHFPERQIYFRSRGVVRFVSLSPRFQAIFLAVAFTATCWIGIASATMVFGNQVIELKDRQIANLRVIRGDLHQQLLTLQDDILSRTQTLQDRQATIDRLLARSQDAIAGNLPSRTMAERFPSTVEPTDFSAPLPVGGPDTPPRAPVVQDAPVKTPDMRKKAKQKLPVVLRGEKTSDAGGDPLTDKLNKVEGMQDVLIGRMSNQVSTTIGRYEQALKIAGLSTDKVLAAKKQTSGPQGGPYVPLRGTTFEDEQQTKALIALMHNVDKLSSLYQVFSQAPLSLPLTDFYISSGFGGRPDPFNGAPAFHSGVDMGSHVSNERIHATAAGRVTFAGRDGPYGLMVEIDHGNGFSTRYGHLKKIMVRQGQHVVLRETVGVMGSTGRSTGTHLHYEVRFNGTPLNPLKIFKAAQHVQAI